MHIRTEIVSKAATTSGGVLMRWSSMTSREQVCSQQVHCLSCPLSVMRTGKDCRELSANEIKEIMEGEERKEQAFVNYDPDDYYE